MKKIYVETSIPSFYFNTRPQVEMAAKKNWTRQWWDKPKPYITLVTGFPVIVELLELPNPTKCQQTLELIRNKDLITTGSLTWLVDTNRTFQLCYSYENNRLFS